jgi:hypothetical protein
MVAVAINPEPKLASAAEDLGAVYTVVRYHGPLGPWAVPPRPDKINDMHSRLMAGIKQVYTEDRYVINTLIDRQGMIDYSRAYYEVIPRVERQAVVAATAGMDRQVGELIKLGRRFSNRGMPEQLHATGNRIGERLGGFMPGPQDEAYASRFGQEAIGEKGERVDRKYQRALQSSFSKRFWEAVGAELAAPDAKDPREIGRQEARDLLRVLSLHSAFSSVLIGYSSNAGGGDAAAHAVLADAIAASAEFKVDILVNPDHVWRYPPLIALAIEQLGLSDVYGFPEYAFELGGVLSQSWVDTALIALGFAVMLVAVFLTGPLAITGLGLDIALFGLGAADVGIASWQAGLTYLREREQDLAATGSAFSARRLAERPDYSATAMAGAAALLSGIAFIFAGVKLGTRAARAAGRTPLPPPTSTDPAAARLRTTRGKGVNRADAIGNRARRTGEGPSPPPARPRSYPPRQRPREPARAAVGAGPVSEPLPDAVSRGQPVGERFTGGRGLGADTPVASGSGRGPRQGGSRPPAGRGAAPTAPAPSGGRARGQSQPKPRERATPPEAKATGGRASDRLSSMPRRASSREYSMIETPARPGAVANPADLGTPKVFPFTKQGRPVGKMDPVLLEVAKDVRAQVAGVGSGDFFKNVAVARVRVGPNGPVRYISVVNTPAGQLGNISRGLDSEQLLLHYVQGRNNERVNYILEALYTERAPCWTCGNLLARESSEIPIFYSVIDETFNLGRAQGLRTAWGL